MWAALRRHWQARQEASALARRAIPDALWRRTIKRFPFLAADEPTQQRLRRMTSLFLDRKEFTGAHGLEVRDDIAVAIAAQACLPVLEIGLQAYDGFVGIVVHPGQAVVRRETTDDDGVVHAWEEVLSGEAVQGGPVMLSWRDVRAAGPKAAQGYNVVVHEFAHVLDMADGLPDGVPLLPPDIDRHAWERTLHQEFEPFCARVDAQEETALDPYGAQAPEEFFAVASESFFVSPHGMRTEHPALYEMFKRYYRQDPATRLPETVSEPKASPA